MIVDILAISLATVIAVRCIRVCHNMKVSDRRCSYPRWAAFGLSYALLCVAALGAAAHILEGHGNPGDWLWLCSSAGLILFDRRTNRAKTAQTTTEAPQHG